MRLFAERGVADVSVRQIAAAAGVSPSLVIHHFGSKEGLKRAADDRATAFLREFLAQLADPAASEASSLAAALAEGLEREQAMLGYLRRLLVDGGPSGDALFGDLLAATTAAMSAMTAAGVTRPTADEQARAAFLLVNDLAVVLLRERLAVALGADPLAGPGLERWTGAVMDVYSAGVFTAGQQPPQP